MHKAVFKKPLVDRANAVCHERERHKLRLHIGRKSRKLSRHDLDGIYVFSGHYRDFIAVRDGFKAHLVKFSKHGPKMRGIGFCYGYLRVRDRSGAKIRARLDPIGDNRYLADVQQAPIRTFYHELVRADTLDLYAACGQNLAKLHHLRLFSDVDQMRRAVSERGGHDDVFAASYCDLIKHDLRAL